MKKHRIAEREKTNELDRTVESDERCSYKRYYSLKSKPNEKGQLQTEAHQDEIGIFSEKIVSMNIIYHESVGFSLKTASQTMGASADDIQFIKIDTREMYSITKVISTDSYVQNKYRQRNAEMWKRFAEDFRSDRRFEDIMDLFDKRKFEWNGVLIHTDGDLVFT